jgi:hypothetical protein
MADMIIPDTLSDLSGPLPIGSLVADAADLLSVATDLPRPQSVDVHEFCQHINLHFDSDPASYSVLALWAERFGATLTSQPWHDDTIGLVTICRVQFEFHGIAIEAFAVIPAALATA